jgi:hypothetical protein
VADAGSAETATFGCFGNSWERTIGGPFGRVDRLAEDRERPFPLAD